MSVQVKSVILNANLKQNLTNTTSYSVVQNATNTSVQSLVLNTTKQSLVENQNSTKSILKLQKINMSDAKTKMSEEYCNPKGEVS